MDPNPTPRLRTRREVMAKLAGQPVPVVDAVIVGRCAECRSPIVSVDGDECCAHFHRCSHNERNIPVEPSP